MVTRVILASHGDLAEGMANAVQMVVGKSERLSWHGLQPGMKNTEIGRLIQQEIEVHPKDQFIIVTDLFRGSVCNICMELVMMKNVQVLCGMNMALILDLLLGVSSPISEKELREKIKQAREGIRLFSQQELQTEEKDESFFL